MVEQDLEYEEESADEAEASEGLERLKEALGFAGRSARRHLVLVLFTFLVVSGIGITLWRTLPRYYVSEVHLTAQRSAALRTLSGSKLEQQDVDNPTRGVSAMILRRDNIVALVEESHLVQQFDATRSPLLKLKDRVLSPVATPPPDDAKARALVGMVEQKLYVQSDDASVTIGIEWMDPEVAYELVTMVQKNFLEARYDSDVAEITESIGVLKEHSKTELAKVDQALAEYKQALDDYVKQRAPPVTEARPKIGRVVVAARSPAETPVRSVAPIDPELAAALEEKRARIRALEAERDRNLATLKQQLAQSLLTLTPLHPTVVAMQQAVDVASQPSPELLQLKAEERALMAQIAPPAPAPADSASPAANASPGAKMLALLAPSPAPAAAAGPPSNPLEGPNGPVRLAHANLELAIGSYVSAMQRIDSANVELDITKTAYKHRYTVLTPAEVPGRPKKSIASLIGIGAVLGGALLGILLAAASDLIRGRVLEAWQVKRQLKVEVLGELDLPS